MPTMASANILVRFVNPAKPGKKNATIKDDDGSIWLIQPATLGQYTPGGTYEVAYEEFSISGNTFRSIKSSKLVGEPPAAGGQTPASPAYSGGNYDPATQERIFVCGAINATLANPNFLPTDWNHDGLVGLVNQFRNVWADTFGRRGGVKAAAPAKNDDMDDEIPFR